MLLKKVKPGRVVKLESGTMCKVLDYWPRMNEVKVEMRSQEFRSERRLETEDGDQVYIPGKRKPNFTTFVPGDAECKPTRRKEL